MRNFAVGVFALSLLISGCGGGAAKGLGSGSTGGETSLKQRSTKFHVDVSTGQVTVVGGTGMKANAEFSGTSIGFNSSVLLDQSGGDTGLKTVNVSLTNNWGLPIGLTPEGSPTGLRVVFGSMVNLIAPPVISGQTSVSTLAGSGSAGTSDGSGLGATFSGPSGVVGGGSGIVYVADASSSLIRKINNGQVSTLAGGGVSGSNGAGKGAGFLHPYGLAINPVDGAIIIADNGGNRIRRMTPAGSVSTIAGTGTASAVNGTGSAATFSKPYGVAVDGTGTIYVAEFGNRLIRKIVYLGGAPTNSANYRVSPLAGNGASGSVDGIATTATFTNPSGLAFDSHANVLYLADAGANRIRRIDLDGNVTTVAGSGALTDVDGNGSVASFKTPSGIVIVGGALIVSTSAGCDIRQLSLTSGASPNVPTSWTVQTLAGTGAAGSADGIGSVAGFHSPLLDGTDASGDIIVPDSLNNKVRMVRPNNGLFPIGTPGGTVQPEPVQLSNASGYVAQTESGTNIPYITYPGSLAAGATTPPQPWNFVIPNGVTAFEFTVTVDAATNILSAPTGSESLTGSPTAIVHTVVGSSQGFSDGLATEAQFNNPFHIAIDQSGVLYVIDNLNIAIRRVGTDGRVSTIVGTAGGGFLDGTGATALLSSPKGVAVSPDGTRVFFSDGNRIRIATIDAGADPKISGNWTISTIAGTSSSGNTDGLGSVAVLNVPWHIALSPGGTLYVSEFSGNRLRRMQLIGGNVSQATSWNVQTLAGDPGSSFGDIDGTGTAARFAGPEGVAVDNAGMIYVSEVSNHRIRKVSPNGVVTTLAGGVSGDTSSAGYVNGPGATAKFNFPTGVAVDSAGYVYVTEYNNNAVRRISPQGETTTVAGTQGSLGNLDGPGNVALFGALRGLAVSTSGNIFVVDATNERVREIERAVTAGTQ